MHFLQPSQRSEVPRHSVGYWRWSASSFVTPGVLLWLAPRLTLWKVTTTLIDTDVTVTYRSTFWLNLLKDHQMYLFFFQYWGLTQGLPLDRQVLYGLSHSTSPFTFIYLYIYLFLHYWGLNSGPSPWVTPLALFCDEFFLRRRLSNYLPGLALNRDPPDLCLLRS
jgi:hypothetical protein